MKAYIYVFLLLIISLDLFSCKPSENKFKYFVDNDEITTINTNNERELIDALEILNNSWGTIYIDTLVISITNSILTILE